MVKEHIDWNLEDRTLHIDDYGGLIYLYDGKGGVWLDKKKYKEDVNTVFKGGFLKQEGEAETWMEAYGNQVILSNRTSQIILTKCQAKQLMKFL